MAEWREILEYDPLTGVRTDFINDEDGKVTIYQHQDMKVAKSLESVATELREDDNYKRKGIQNSWMHAALIPKWVYSKIHTEYGIKMPLQQGKEVLKIVQRDFPWCMTAKGRF